MDLLKIGALLLGTLSTYTAMTPPQPPVPASERPKEVITPTERLFSSSARVYAATAKLLVCSGALLEVVVILARKYPTHRLSEKILETLVNGPVSLASRINISNVFLVGIGLATFGGFIRYQCYRALGRFFTFEVAVKNDHQLVTTGPYAYVRHPSYTGARAALIGIGICYASPGSWMRECRIFDTVWGKAAATAYVAFLIAGISVAVVRPPIEDALLRKKFGTQWHEWAKRVPYRLIPYIY